MELIHSISSFIDNMTWVPYYEKVILLKTNNLKKKNGF